MSGGRGPGGTGAPGYLDLSDEDLLRECAVENARGSGPGGQHRNKVETGVRIRHLPTGRTGQAFERRSREQNFAEAVVRLRQDIALRMRRPVDLVAYEPPAALRALLPGAPGGQLGPNNPHYWTGVQHLLDLFAACECSMADTAARLGVSTGALSRVFGRSPAVLAEANRLRAGRGLAPLRR